MHKLCFSYFYKLLMLISLSMLSQSNHVFDRKLPVALMRAPHYWNRRGKKFEAFNFNQIHLRRKSQQHNKITSWQSSCSQLALALLASQAIDTFKLFLSQCSDIANDPERFLIASLLENGLWRRNLMTLSAILGTLPSLHVSREDTVKNALKSRLIKGGGEKYHSQQNPEKKA